MITNSFNITHWVVHHRDGRPVEVYTDVDSAWAVSIAETAAGRPQPYIQQIKSPILSNA